MTRRDWDTEIAQYARQHGLSGEMAEAIRGFVRAKMRLDSVEVSLHGIETEFSSKTTARFSEMDTAEVELPDPTSPADRYLDLGPIGHGGMGEVRRVRDAVLNRFLAMKILRPEFTEKRPAVLRFLAEAQATAQLQHPGVVPVHDVGRLPDGRWFFTMKELSGDTFEDVVNGYLEGDERYTLRGLIAMLMRVCETVAYAHAHGAIHRDIKPANVLIGAFGEVVVLDWGLVKATGTPEGSTEVVTDLGHLHTRMGVVVGTPAYMPPEQARGAHDELGPPTDVYAIGAVLYEILSARRPYDGEPTEVIAAIRSGPPEPLPAAIPVGLGAICDRAMEREPVDRYANAGELGEALRDWLNGAERRERAMEIVRQADALQPELESALQASARHAAAAEAFLRSLAPHAPVSQKRPGWEHEKRAQQERIRADLLGIQRLQLLRSALNEMPGLPSIHERLAYVYHFCHERAERMGDERETAQYAQLLKDHDRGKYASYLEGTGALTLRTRPAGARVGLFRFEVRDRRLFETPVEDLPTAPFTRLPLGRGSWLLEVRADGRAPVRYPVWIERNGHSHGVAPGAKAPEPVTLPDPDELGPDDCYVPAGWTQIGPRPMKKVWVEAFVMRRYPVTNREYLEFLNDLIRQGREQDAERFAPQTQGSSCYERDLEGRFMAPTGREQWMADRPVVCVDRASALAYSRWLGARTGFDWRLPWEDEWEKAARGVDGRAYVMGDHLDPSWADVRGCIAEPAYKPVDMFPEDVSVYGVRGMSGGVATWCMDAYAQKITVEGQRVHRTLPNESDPTARAAWRGGFRNIPVDQAKTWIRQGMMVDRRMSAVGFRLARDYEEEDIEDETSGVWKLDDPPL